MRDFCPDPEIVAAAAENRLTADEERRLRNHATACDDCRRELALVRMQADVQPAPMPAAMRERLRSTVARAVRERGTGRRTRAYRTSRTSPAAALAAVLVLSLAAILAALYARRRAEPTGVPVVESPRPKQTPTHEPARTPERRVEESRRPPVREWPPQVPEHTRRPDGKKPEESREETAEKKPGPRPRPPTPREEARETTVARVFGEVTITDVTGEVAIVRGRDRRPARGIVSVSDGDVLVAEKASSFHIEGRHAIVLPAEARVSIASSATEQATWVAVRSGAVLVHPDASAGSRWVVSDGRRAVVVDKTRARFAAARHETGLGLAALSEALRLAPDGGRAEVVNPGDEWTPAGVVACAQFAAYTGQLSSSLPSERSVFFATCDADDLKRGRWAVADGAIEKERKEQFLRAVEKRHRVLAALRLEIRVNWDIEYVVRLRYRTNAKSLRIEFPLPQNQGMLLAEIDVSREVANRWVIVELPLNRFQVVGSGRILLGAYDRMESVEFSVPLKETHGGRAALAIDDVQILDR